MNKAKVTAKPGEATMVIERMFDAPRAKVFEAHTKKEMLEKWWVGPGYKADIKKIDARDGGSWEFVLSNEKGEEFRFFGSFHEVSPERIVQTTEFGPATSGHAAIERIEFIDMPGGQTRMLATSAFLSVEDRDGLIQSGMEEGMNNTYAKLDEILRGAK